jgi:phage-related protein
MILAASSHAIAESGGMAMPPWDRGNMSLAADLSALATSPVMARRGPAHRDAAGDIRYVLPEEARDGAAMIARAGNGRPLPEDLRNRMEAVLGQDLRSVRVHTDGVADGLARSVDARAFTVGEHIVFAQGEFNPGSHAGDELIGHELTHVMQFRRGDPNTRTIDPTGVKAAEDEADRGGARAAARLGQPEFSAAVEIPDTATEPEADAFEQASAEEMEVAPSAPAPGAIAARDDVSASELARLVHRYRRLHRRVQNEEETLREFNEQADAESRSDQAAEMEELRGDLQRDREGRDGVIARIRELKGEAYANAIVERYSGDQETGPWTFERETTLAEGRRGGGVTTEAPEEESSDEGGDSAAGSEEGGEQTEESSEDTPEGEPAASDGGGGGGGGAGSGEGGGDVTHDLASGPVNTDPPSPPPRGDPGAEVDSDAAGTPEQTDGPGGETTESAERGGGAESERTLHPAEGGVPEAGSTPEGEPERYVLHEGEYADVVLDVAYMDFDTNLEGNLGQAASLPELAQELRQANGIADVVRLMSQFDQDRFQMTGEIRAALDLIRATMTIEGAPWPVTLGGQEMLCDWSLVLTARAYAELYATGEVNPNLGNLSLEMVGRAGAAALAEASAAMNSAIDWMGDAYGNLAEASVTAAGSAGAAAAAHVNLRVGPGVIEISGGASLTWGLGGSVRGRLLVAILPSLELIAAYLGVDMENLPEPLNNVYQFFIDNPNVLSGILEAWNWLQEMQPLQLLADLLSSEEFWALFDRLVEQGVESIQIVNWIRENYVQLDDTPPNGTVCGHAFESDTIWYLLSFGMEFLQWLERITRDVALELLPIMRSASRVVLTAIMAAGPWIVDLVRTMWSTLARWGEMLGERFGPVLAAVGSFLGTIYQRFGEPVVDWVLEAVGNGWTWVTTMIEEHGPAVVEWFQNVPERVQAWFEETTPVVINALYEGGQRLIDAVSELGQGVLEYIEQWAPGVVAIFRQIGEDLYNRIVEYGVEFFQFVVRVGENALQFVGPHAERIWNAIREGAPEFVNWLAEVAREQIQPLLSLLDAHGGEMLQQVRDWIIEHGPAFAQWVTTNFEQFVTTCQEVWAAISPHLQAIGQHAMAFFEWVMEVSAPVREWLTTAAAWFFTQLSAQGAEFLRRMRQLGDLAVTIYEWGEPYLVQAIGLMEEGAEWLADVIEEYGPQALTWIGETSEAAMAWFTEASRDALRHLIAAGTWARDLLVAIGEPLIPVLQAWGERLAELGEQVKDDLIAAWRDYGEPVFRFMLQVGQALWDQLGEELSRAMPIIDRFVREGAAAAEQFIRAVIEQNVDAMQVLYELTANGLSELYTWATTEGVELAQRLATNAVQIVNHMREAGERALFHFLEFGDWVLEVGENAAQPYAEVLDEYGDRYGEIFRTYGVPILRFFHELGEAAARLITEFGEALAQKIVELGEAIWSLAREILEPALEALAQFGTWVWDHIVEFGRAWLDVQRQVIEAVGEAAVWAWQNLGRPIVRWHIERAQEAIALLREVGQEVYRVVVAVGEWWINVQVEIMTRVFRWAVQAGEWLINLVVEIGTPIVEFMGLVAEAIWNDLVDKWEQFGRPVVDFCIRVGAAIGEIMAVVGDWFWEQIQAQARFIYQVYSRYGAPVLQWVGEKAIEAGAWLWEMVVTLGRAHLNFIRDTGALALRGLRTAARAAWQAALELGAEFERLWDRYGQRAVDALVEAGRFVVQVYQDYAAPVVNRCMDAIADAGQKIWEAVVTIGEGIWSIAEQIGSAIWGWIRDTAAAQWRLLQQGGRKLWNLAARAGRAALDLIQEYGPQVLNFCRELTEAAIQDAADRGAAVLRLILEGGAQTLEAIGQVGVGLIALIQQAPHLPGLIQERGVAFARMAQRHGLQFVNNLRNAPGAVLDLVMEHGDWLARKIVEHGTSFVRLIGSHGGRFVRMVREHGDWLIDLVSDFGGRVLELAEEYGTRFLEALREWGRPALSMFG